MIEFLLNKDKRDENDEYKFVIQNVKKMKSGVLNDNHQMGIKGTVKNQ